MPPWNYPANQIRPCNNYAWYMVERSNVLMGRRGLSLLFSLVAEAVVAGKVEDNLIGRRERLLLLLLLLLCCGTQFLSVHGFQHSPEFRERWGPNYRITCKYSYEALFLSAIPRSLPSSSYPLVLSSS